MAVSTSTPSVDAMTQADAAALMDRMYRLQRHIYDPTRKYYLLGRDTMLEGIDAPVGGRVLEVGCGTGRNLIALARCRPDLRLEGLDASAEMLKSAGSKLVAAGLAGTVRLRQALAEEVEAGDEPYDAILFSYSLSMIPTWRPAIDRALASLKPGGAIHVVDFWDQAELPGWFRAVLVRWLRLFHVEHRPQVLTHFRHLEAQGLGTVELHGIARRYAYRLVMRKGAV